MSPVLDLDPGRRQSLTRVVRAWLKQHAEDDEGAGTRSVTGAPSHQYSNVDSIDVSSAQVEILEVEILHPGRPGLLDVLADVDGRTAQVVVGLRRPSDEQHFLRPGDEGVLGLVEDNVGMAVAVDALKDAEMAPLLLASILGNDAALKSTVAAESDDREGITLTFDAWSLTVFPWPATGPHPGVDLLMSLDEASFNHLAAPVARWQRRGSDLGVVQEMLVGSAPGWALALTSLRDLYGSGGRPEDAGGDFGPESKALGIMTARMHLALDRAFGRRAEPVGDWVQHVGDVVGQIDPSLLEGEGVLQTIAQLRTVETRGATLRTHGDLHLGRIARTDHGWVVADCLPGGRPPGSPVPVFRSPLCDVADMLWSFQHVASVAAAERDPSGQMGLAKLAVAWASYNRRAFLAGYLATPGIGGLVPNDRELVRNLAGLFELQRAAMQTRVGSTTH